jgi:DNA-binding GntR family transcriptional regulator
VSSLSLSQQAYQHIKRKIVSLELAPGAVINRTTLQEELGLGRTPVREALQRLAQEMLVKIVPRQGMFVTDIGLTDLQRLSEVRFELESLAAALAAQRGTAAHWRRMEVVLSDLPPGGETAVVRPDVNEAMIAIDEACHEIIYEAADNPFLHHTLTTLYALSLRLWYYSLDQIGGMRQAIQEHQAMLERLQEGDGEGAARLMRQHIQAFQTEIQSSMIGTGG